MKILVINPNSDEETRLRIVEKVHKFAPSDWEVDVISLKSTPKLMASYEDEAKAIPEMEQIIREGSQYDAFIDACHSDPNLDFLQEITEKPVVGIAEASMKMASMEGHGFAIISPSVFSIPKKRTLARKYCCDFYYQAAVVCQTNENEDLYETAKLAVEQYHVDTIVLGCANYTNADKFIENKLGVRVFDGIACAMIIAAGMVMYKEYKR
jgi:allantoin racemase